MLKDELEILQERARVISGFKTKHQPTGELRFVVEFILFPEKYAIDGSFVSEVLPIHHLTIIPGAPSFITGIMNIRGKITSITNLKRFFNLKEKGLTTSIKILVIKHQLMEFGILSDEIIGINQLDIGSLNPPPVTLHGEGAGYILGVTPEGTILLDAVAILSDNALIINQK